MRKIFGHFDGLRGFGLYMTKDQALGASHIGECDKDVEALTNQKEIARQLDQYGPEKIYTALFECGAWMPAELKDETLNRQRAVYLLN